MTAAETGRQMGSDSRVAMQRWSGVCSKPCPGSAWGAERHRAVKETSALPWLMHACPPPPPLPRVHAGRVCGQALLDANNDAALSTNETTGVGSMAVALILGGSMARTVLSSTTAATLGRWCHYITEPGAQTVSLSFTPPAGQMITVPLSDQSWTLAADGVLEQTVPAVGVAHVGERVRVGGGGGLTQSRIGVLVEGWSVDGRLACCVAACLL